MKKYRMRFQKMNQGTIKVVYDGSDNIHSKRIEWITPENYHDRLRYRLPQLRKAFKEYLLANSNESQKQLIKQKGINFNVSPLYRFIYQQLPKDDEVFVAFLTSTINELKELLPDFIDNCVDEYLEKRKDISV